MYSKFDEYIDSRGYGVSSKIRNETWKNRRSVNVAYGISLWVANLWNEENDKCFWFILWSDDWSGTKLAGIL